ncbi:kinase-like domain-containing protein [Mycena galericulata]|nr:kinase-like domain-containing protein [Mycena galericulata]
MDCGAAARNFKGDRCGRCKRLYKQLIGEQDDTLLVAERQRGQEFQARMAAGKQKKKEKLAASSWNQPLPVPSMSWKGITSGAPSQSMTTANLENLRSRTNGSLGRMLSVNITPMVDGTESNWLPSASNLYHEATQVSDIQDDFLRTLNTVWESACGITCKDVNLRWHGNAKLLPGSSDGTIGKLFDTHKGHLNPDLFFNGIPEKWSHLRGEVICFELYIDVVPGDLEDNCTPVPHPVLGKRSQPADLEPPKTASFKRLRARIAASKSSSVPEESIISTSSSEREYSTSTPISLFVATTSVNQDDGRVEVLWDSGDTREAVLDLQSFARGKTKKVYRLMLDDEPYVAKRFFEVGRGPECVSVDENATQLENEMIRLIKGQWFLDKFHARAEETETEVSNDFIFSSGLLVREIIGPSGPSPASSVTADSFQQSLEANPDSAVVWLLEPLRGSAMERWSGTLKHPNHENKPGQTMDAFMHFSYVYSQKTLIFADLQGSKGRSRLGNIGWILFDVMTHTLDGTSGVGDHGEDGIQAILSDHICERMCCGLDMGTENIMAEPDKPKRKVGRPRKSRST